MLPLVYPSEVPWSATDPQIEEFREQVMNWAMGSEGMDDHAVTLCFLLEILRHMLLIERHLEAQS